MKKIIRLILALAIGSTLIGCSSKPGGTIDLTSNIKVTIKGYNGKGEVYVDNNTKYDKTNSDIRDFVSNVEYTLENGENGALSNGDEITIKYDGVSFTRKIVGLINVPDHVYDVKDASQLIPNHKNYGFLYMSVKEAKNFIIS